jgi:hypothetical protein
MEKKNQLGFIGRFIPSENKRSGTRTRTNEQGSKVFTKISDLNISEDDARKLIKDMGMNDWHTRDGYLSNVSHAVEEVIGRKSIPFSQFAKDYTLALK